MSGSQNKLTDSLSRWPRLDPKENMMTSESSRGPTDYVCRKEEGSGHSSDSDFGANDECRHEVNVIDSNRGPKVQVNSDKEQ